MQSLASTTACVTPPAGAGTPDSSPSRPSSAPHGGRAAPQPPNGGLPPVAAERLAARLAAISLGARDALFDWDRASDRVRFSARIEHILGPGAARLGERPEDWFARVHAHDVRGLRHALAACLAARVPVLEHGFRMQHTDGSWRRILCRAVLVPQGDMLGGSLTDVTQVQEAQARLAHDAFHDPLTGLPNRQIFLDRIGSSLRRSRRRGAQEVAVLYWDLDRFRTVNDSLGPDAGDRLLIEVTRRIQNLVRPGDTFARLGGDKFGLLMAGVSGVQDAARTAADVAELLAEPFVINGTEILPSASAGIALSSTRGARAEDLLNDSVTAMHRAKEDGATRYEVFDPKMGAQAKERLRLEADLRRAVRRGEFLLHYQPIISLETGRLSSFEALVRWRHPERGFIRPDAFIRVAEETGLIMPLGSWVLEQACAQLVSWHERFPENRDVAMAVNLSALQFEDPGLVEEVVRTLERTGLDPSSLKLEMTESVVMARTRENAATLAELRALGIRILIDDFGTGYSSLASLHSFPLDSLKIDRSFVSSMEFEDERTEIVRTILALATNLGLDVVAEGIETVGQLRMLKDLRCQHGQGFYFSNAVDGESAAAWLAASPRW